MGIISTLLDEALAYARGAEAGAGEAAVTAELTVRFKKPVQMGFRSFSRAGSFRPGAA